MTDVRTLRRGEAVALSSLSGHRGLPELTVSVAGPGPLVDVVALLLGPDGKVGDDRDLVFFNQPSSAGGAVSVDPAAASARIRTGAVEERVARVLVGCAGEALAAGRATTFRVDVSRPGGTLLATAVIEVPADHRAESVLEVYRWGAGWRLRLLGEGYTAGLEGWVRDHGVQVDGPGSAAPAPVRPVPTAVVPPVPTSPPPPAPPRQAPPPTRAPRPRRRRRVPLLIGAGATAVVAVVLAGTFPGGHPEPQPRAVAAASSTPAAVPPTTSATRLAAASAAVVPAASVTQGQLALLPVRGRAPTTGYDRAQFGQSWADVDRNGCDTRNDVLRRDVAGAVVDPATHGCVVVSGEVADPYSGTTIPFVRAATSSAAVQIDHVVALGDAWQTGAQALDAARRTQFANDPANLLAVDGALNAQKGDGDAATWLPPNTAFRCTYVAMQVAVKRTYGLWSPPPSTTRSPGCSRAAPVPPPRRRPRWRCPRPRSPRRRRRRRAARPPRHPRRRTPAPSTTPTVPRRAPRAPRRSTRDNRATAASSTVTATASPARPDAEAADWPA